MERLKQIIKTLFDYLVRISFGLVVINGARDIESKWFGEDDFYLFALIYCAFVFYYFAVRNMEKNKRNKARIETVKNFVPYLTNDVDNVEYWTNAINKELNEMEYDKYD